ncbi:pumilio domain member 6 [Pichia californica]|uniref:Pumilio domain member 6 n=1 Tax=Pichia californica TaxID=460514 RepID=A0A9P6WPJ0_9ASCO|nr:pumilio domain member 6 [[Candida] californica]KAG0690924.1 pumilio domain member 6 [[Candida] californica]
MSIQKKGNKRSAETAIEKTGKKVKKTEVVSESESESESGSENTDSSEDDEDDLDKMDDSDDDDEEGEGDEEDSNEKSDYVDPDKKTSKEQHEEQRKLLKERKNKRKSGIEVERIKKLWEKLRVKNPPMPKEIRDKLSNETWELCEGVLGDLVLKHDASRVVQTLVKYSSKERRDEICRELKPYYYKLATSAYGKYLLIKLLHYGSKESRAAIIKGLHGKLRKLMRHREGAYVVEDLFVLYSTAKQRHEMIKEFWGSQFAYFSDENDTRDVVEVCAESTEKKKLISGNLYGTIKASIEKGSIGFQILHAAMKEFVKIFEGQEVRDFIDLVTEQFAQLVHTPEGCEVACVVFAKATAKERRGLLKSLKEHAEALATNEHGQTVLQIIFMTIDDTVSLSKTFLPTFEGKMDILLVNKFSRRPFIYLLNGLDKSYFSPIVLKDINRYVELSKETSKKPAEDRRKQTLNAFLPAFYDTLLKKPYEILNENIGAQFIQELLYNNEFPDTSNELRAKAIDTIIDCVRGDLSNEDHLINKAYTPRLLKSLIQGGKWNRETKKIDEIPDISLGLTFAVKFVEEIFDSGKDDEVLATWISNKESSFVLVALCDKFKEFPKNQTASSFIKELKKQKKTINKQDESNKGAKLLAKVLF